ncbi:MAG: T9SS type A sorting domain-containing protein, partial [Candidatus Krumholzibacteria bacterium]|nr:T9SS type A sorting domain-containing protein [Candidatus Krumholzibacteria bacterium]
AGETRLRLVAGDPALIEQAASTLPQPYALLPAYPNPFNPSTTVVFTLPRQSRVRIDLFDVSGRRLRTLVDEVRGPGRHEAVWDGTGQDGRGISSGVYFARLRADGFEQTRKLTLVR